MLVASCLANANDAVRPGGQSGRVLGAFGGKGEGGGGVAGAVWGLGFIFRV